ncbi:exostosin-like 3 [Haliotis cracherodii]|uniref:exostosin-like 3 n=1 Tax=Haliotis cracherodii TaxID=6455 RepID=UPI0039E96A3E
MKVDRSGATWLRGRVCVCLRHMVTSKCILVFLCLFITVPLVGHYYLSNIAGDIDHPIHRSRTKLDYPDSDIDLSKSSELKHQIEELRRIKASVNNELRDLESKRQKLQAEVSGYTTHIDTLKSQYETINKEVSQLKIALDQLRVEKEETIMQYIPNIKAPQRILMEADPSENIPLPMSPQSCRMHSCFDYTPCSLVSGFPVFVYNPEGSLFGSHKIVDFVQSSFISSLQKSVYVTTDPMSACLFVVLVGEIAEDQLVDRAHFERQLHDLPHWHGDGRNHIILNLARSPSNKEFFTDVNTGRAMMVQSVFVNSVFRPGFDVLVPPNFGIAEGDTWQDLPSMSPVRRKYLISFWGEAISSKLAQNIEQNIQSIQNTVNENGGNVQRVPRSVQEVPQGAGQEEELSEEGEDDEEEDGNFQVRTLKAAADATRLVSLEASVVAALKKMHNQIPDTLFLQFSCDGPRPQGSYAEWGLCGNNERRSKVLSQSTFSLVLPPTNFTMLSTTVFQIRLYESLKYGAIPIILGDHVQLPFSEILDWRLAAIFLPVSRVTEIHFFLRTFTDSDISQMRQHGRFLWETYMSNSKRILDTTLAVFRTRLQIPAKPVKEEPTPSVFNASFIPLKFNGPEMEPETDEVLGPTEARFPSEKFYRNYTQFINYNIFNKPGDPFHLYPYQPFDTVLPSEAKYLGSGYGFRSIGKGAGGSGKEFSGALGGNIQREQFTIVMLTYEREAVLIKALQRLKGLPFLNKVIVVWNNPIPPSPELRWPDIHVPLEIVKTFKNSLNNRFLPYDSIETEAILSIDDDAHLRHDEIIFGFRVWREERERIVGFPGRFHAWDLKHQSWLYNSNYSCELSMVLTGAAFFHKYYSYLYSYVMPAAIRDKVDEYTNCEDIAMNFLVSHITRKPPIKVTSRWTFRCPGCPQTLSSNDSHFQERHKCINFFVKVYGYMPLLYTQYRVDSVLFKTRLPHDKQKCFKYI